MRVLFLDFDGVLNSHTFFNYTAHLKARGLLVPDENVGALDEFGQRTVESVARGIDPYAAANLWLIMEKVPDMKIVISSTWRVVFPLDLIKSALSFRGIDATRVIGKTDEPIREGRGEDCVQRGDLCLKWATENSVTDFICVDDDSDFDRVKYRFVQTNWKDGLTFSKAAEIIQKFGFSYAD